MAVPAPGRLKQEDEEFKVILGYRASSRSSLDALQVWLQTGFHETNFPKTIKTNKKKNLILKRYVYTARTARAIPQRNPVLNQKKKKTPKKREVYYLTIR